MFERIHIKNFKSITDVDIELGRVNVFIGANGVGKSSLLEAVAMLSARKENEVDLNKLSQSGVRVARPDLMRNSFWGKKAAQSIEIEVEGYGAKENFIFTPKDEDYFMSPWTVKREDKEHTGDFFKYAEFVANIASFEIYTPLLDALRGLSQQATPHYPVGLHGEDFDVLLNMLPQEKKNEIVALARTCISWIDSVVYDESDQLRLSGLKLGRSKSHLFFRDKFMQKKMSMFSAENANEGALVILFYLTLLMSDKAPAFFAIDNIDTGLNPRMCRFLMKLIGEKAAGNRKQLIVTTHNPAFLDGMNLNDENQRLFEVYRSDEGHTKVRRLKVKPVLDDGKKRMKLSEMWMNGILGGVPTNF